MQTRSDSPFPTSECTDSECTESVPDSTRSDLCATCENFTQTFGEQPANVDDVEIAVEREWLFGEVTHWKIRETVNGSSEWHKPYGSEEQARRRARELRAIASAALD